MSVLYFKSSINRKEKFQIKTKIINCNNTWHVEKEAATAEAVSHIQNLYRNVGLASKIYGEKTTVGELIDNKFIVPYFKAVSLGDKLRNSLKSENAWEELTQLCSLWKELILGNKENCCKFYQTEEFKNIFGQADELLGDEAVLISNLDCSSENILFLPDEKIKIIDYEWIYPFPIPSDFLIYRVIKIFYIHNKDYINWSALLHYFDIKSEKIPVYERLLEKFEHFIETDDRKGINYGKIGFKFLNAKINSKGKNRNYTFAFPENQIPAGSRLVIYGAGRVGMDYYNYALSSEDYTVTAWVDKQASVCRKQGLNVMDCSMLKEQDFDYILISVLSEDVKTEIMAELSKMQIPKEKMLWFKPDFY